MNRGKIYGAGMAFGLTLPLLLCLVLSSTGGCAEAAPGSVVSADGNGKIASRVAVVEAQAVQANDDPGPYGSGKAILNVTSKPGGAAIFLGDRLLGVTPWFGADLPAGRFTLSLRLSGHKSFEEVVQLTDGLVVNKDYTLIAGSGSLMVQTSPPGARVYLDGLEQKGKTPMNINEVPAGAHLVKVHLDRYFDAEKEVVVAVNWPSQVRFDLKGGHLEVCGDKWLEPEAATRCRVEREERQRLALSGEFVKVKGGCFQMGDTFGDGWSDETPVHEVCVDDFAIGKFEVTQGQWLAVMGGNPSYFKSSDNFPVEQVSWTEAQNFISRLNVMVGRNFRMPSEAEWEYAARSGGKKELYAGGDKLAELAWYDGNSGPATHAVGSKRPNGLGIYDMSGNVGEWVQDWYDSEYYRLSPDKNPVGPLSGFYGRVIRGGGWNINAALARAANRDRYEPTNRFAAVGFRLAYSIK